jgi:hypothetical protein
VLVAGVFFALRCGQPDSARFESKLKDFGDMLDVQTTTRGEPNVARLCSQASALLETARDLAAEPIPPSWSDDEQLVKLQVRKIVQATGEFVGRCQTNSKEDLLQAYEILVDQYHSLRSLIASFD